MTTDHPLMTWTGDIDELRGYEDELAEDPELCSRVFMDRQEAFNAGRALALTPQQPLPSLRKGDVPF